MINKNITYSFVLIIFTILFSFPFILTTSSQAETIDPNSKLVGYVWDDYDINGFYDSNEKGLNNLKINLLKSNTTEVITSTNTDTNGNYAITAPEGIYDLQFINPSGYEIANSEKFLTNIENNILKGIKILDKAAAFKTLAISTAFVTTDNPNVKYNKFFNEEFNKTFNQEFNAEFNKKFNEFFNKVFNLGYDHGMDEASDLIEFELPSK